MSPELIALILNIVSIVTRRVVEAIQRGDEIVTIPVAELKIDRTAAQALAEAAGQAPPK